LRQQREVQGKVARKVEARLSHACRANIACREANIFDKRPANAGSFWRNHQPNCGTIRRAQFFGTDHVMKGLGSAAKRMLRDGRTRRAFCTRGKATHTDPQLLFSAAS